MKNMMKELQENLSKKFVLVDDWNALGWVFNTIEFGRTIVCSLTNYTECKAEGGTITFTIESDWTKGTGPDVFYLKILRSDGSGPHGIPWWDEVISDGMVVTDAIELANAIRSAMMEEGQSDYWQPWRDGKPQRSLLFQTEISQVLVPYPWDENDWNEAVSRSEE